MRKKILLGLLVVCSVVAPFLVGDYIIGMLVSLLIMAYLGQCWNIMGGYAGQFSFGHAVFFGLGAYTSSLLYVDLGVNPYIGIFLGMAVAGVIGLLIGFLSFRYKLKGNYFALATLAFAEIFRVIFNNTKVFKAAEGVSIPYVNDWTVFQFSDRKVYYFIALAMVIGITIFISTIRKKRTGLYLVALRDNENAAGALGINVFRYKLFAITISAMLTGLMGTFAAQYYSYIDASFVFGTSISIDAIAPCIVGGAGTAGGPLIGAVVLSVVEEFTNSWLSGVSGVNMIIYGLILILTIMFCPKGIMGIFDKVKAKYDEKHVKS